MTIPEGKLARVFFKLLAAIFFAALLWSFLFAGFLIKIQAYKVPDTHADGIVVLTGGPGRIDAAFIALAEGRGQRLLISGLNQELDNATVLKDIGQDEALIACCVDAEDASTNTVGNAKEALDWARAHGYRSILLITADFHLPRSLRAFEAYDPDITVVPYPVKAPVRPFTLAMEFNKYLLSLARIDLKT